VNATVRFAVVGCGTAARQIHLPALRGAGADVTAFASRSPSSALAARDQWGSGEVVERWDEAVRRDDVDAVVITTPNALHRDVAVAAAEAGKHVLVDKPLACTTVEADAMLAAARAAGVVLVPFQNLRFAPPFVAAYAAVAEGRIGRVTGVRAAFGHAGPEHWAPHATWFRERVHAGGGCLIDLGVHIVDVVRYVTGDEIIEVTALLEPPVRDVEVDAQLLVRLAGGAIGSVQASWTVPTGHDLQLTVIGTDATLHLDSHRPLTLFTRDGERERLPLPDAAGSPLDELLAAVRGERAPSVTGTDGRAAVAVVEAAYRSAESGALAAVQ
jgi:predicted dehydrogenase